MANRIKGITVEISGDTTKLQNALKGVNGQIRTPMGQCETRGQEGTLGHSCRRVRSLRRNNKVTANR